MKLKIFTKFSYKKLILVILFIILILSITIFLCKNLILNHIAKEKISELNKNYGLNINYQSLKIKGINTLQITNFQVSEKNKKAILKLASLDAKISVPYMLLTKIKLKQINLNNLELNFIKRDSISNYNFLFHLKDTTNNLEKQSKKRQILFGRTANKIFDFLLNILPQDGSFKNIRVYEQKDSNFVSFSITDLHIKDHKFDTQLLVCEDNITQKWLISAILDTKNNTIKFKSNSVPNSYSKHIRIPYITRRFGAQITLDTLSLLLKHEYISRDSAILKTGMNISGLYLYHRAISPEQINLNNGNFNYKINLGERTIELDSSSNFKFNALSFNSYMRIIKNENSSKGLLAPWHFTISINKPWFNSQELFQSLPSGLFENLEGIKTSGRLSYKFYLDLNFALPDSLKFLSQMQTQGFKIVSFGKEDLSKMSKEFLYTAYEKSQAVRTFPVGSTWENFIPLDSIPQTLINAVLQSEDGSFMGHNGFLPQAMREAIIYDIKAQKFARGASTISMQLVKNVFLNKKKNIARKLEEAMIVWLIESKGLTTKNRMLEVYFNIIEWGPMIYGIKEASEFYFSKHPSQLSLDECIYLASIIPKPKHYLRYFTPDNKINPKYLDYYFQRIATLLARKGIITEEEALLASPSNVMLNGKAANFNKSEP